MELQYMNKPALPILARKWKLSLFKLVCLLTSWMWPGLFNITWCNIVITLFAQEKKEILPLLFGKTLQVSNSQTLSFQHHLLENMFSLHVKRQYKNGGPINVECGIQNIQHKINIKHILKYKQKAQTQTMTLTKNVKGC